MHVAVLYGGWSAERDVSLNSGRAVADALAGRGHRVSLIDVGRDIAEVLATFKPEAAFNALHGRFGEDGGMQGILEMLEIPYTHSGLLASALAMDKPMAKNVFAAVGIRCAEGKVVTRAELVKGDPLPRPYVVKPLNEGSSVGVTIVTKGENVNFEETWPFGETVLIERYIAGREVQVAVLDDEALGAIEIRPRGRFYDYTAKYTDGMAEHHMPAPIHPKAMEEVLELAVRAHKALGCRGLTRADFRYDDTEGEPGTFYLLEINTQPGMTALSLSPEIAAWRGIDFPSLVERLLECARCGE